MAQAEHHPLAAEAVKEGEVYRCAFRGVPLYEARIERIAGCWATVRVVQPLEGPHKRQYAAGQEFDIRLASYSFES